MGAFDTLPTDIPVNYNPLSITKPISYPWAMVVDRNTDGRDDILMALSFRAT